MIAIAVAKHSLNLPCVALVECGLFRSHLWNVGFTHWHKLY